MSLLCRYGKAICRLSGNIPLSLEWILYQNSILAFRAGGKQRDRAADEFLDPAGVFDGLRGQIRPGTGIRGRLLPALDGLVDRLDPGLRALARGQVVDLLAVQPVGGADLDLLEAVEDVELGQRQPVDAAGAHRLAPQHRVEPAASGAAAADLLADLVVELGRERPLPHPRGVGLADAEQIGRAHV